MDQRFQRCPLNEGQPVDEQGGYKAVLSIVPNPSVLLVTMKCVSSYLHDVRIQSTEYETGAMGFISEKSVANDVADHPWALTFRERKDSLAVTILYSVLREFEEWEFRRNRFTDDLCVISWIVDGSGNSGGHDWTCSESHFDSSIFFFLVVNDATIVWQISVKIS